MSALGEAGFTFFMWAGGVFILVMSARILVDMWREL